MVRALNIASINPDSTKEEQTQRDIIKNLARHRIHIAAIQETHITQARDYLLYNYRVVTEASNKREETGLVQGGKAIMIHESMQQYITQIARRSSRVRRVTQGRKNSQMPIQILTNYAPHNGHTEEDRDQHWGGSQGNPEQGMQTTHDHMAH